eukprot:7804295-Pyramimonas_sp.AAC.1
MRPTPPLQQFVAPEGARPPVPVAQSACVPPFSQYSSSWPQTELHRRPQWRSPHALPPPSTAVRGLRGSSAEGSRGAVRMRFARPV